MPHQTRVPSVKLTLERDLFNQLLGTLENNIEIGIIDEHFSSIAEKLKNKLLRYSVPRISDDGIEFVDVRFFPNEASDMIWQLLLRIEKRETVEDSFSILINNRESK